MSLIKEFKEIIKKYSREDVVFGKKEKYILDRISTTKEEVIDEIIYGKDLEFVEKQERTGEIRYALFFVYSCRKGRVYVIRCDDKLRIITAYPLGKKTLLKYRKKRFIS